MVNAPTTGSAKTSTPEFPMMEDYLVPLRNPGKRQVVGRNDIVDLVAATLNRREICNVALLGEAGTGKTTVAYEVSARDHLRDYYEVRLSLMSASTKSGENGSVQMATRLTKLIDEVTRYQQITQKELVLFMDEFHLIMEISPAAVEAIKPILANSGSRHIKIIVATTYDEYRKYIRPNEALDQRLERISLPELSSEATRAALQNALDIYAPNEVIDPKLPDQIVTVTNRVLPSQKQPRKSLRLLDAMFGWHNTFGDPLNRDLLAKMVKSSIGADIDYQADVNAIETRLNNRVYDQGLAVRALVERLYVSVAGLNDPNKPRASFLFTGSTGVGKTELAKALAANLLGSEHDMIRFDMSEFSKADSVDRLKNSLAEAIWEHPSSVVLLDEIEKGATECGKLLLQIIDDARLSDENGRETSFRDAYVILTTNVGSKVFNDIQDSYSKARKLIDNAQSSRDLQQAQAQQHRVLREYMPLIHRALSQEGDGKGGDKFPPELLGRFDQIVPFAPIGESTRLKICQTHLERLGEVVMQKYQTRLHYDDRLYTYIVSEHIGSNEADNGGGREVIQRVEREVKAKVAQALLENPDEDELAVVIEGTMAVESPNDRIGGAQVAIKRWNHD